MAPGEAAAPGSASGKTGTPVNQSVGTAFNVTVNAVAPGTMMGTRMTSRLAPELVARTTKAAALQKPVDRDDVAQQILAFCRSDSTTGQVLVLDSGVVYY